MIQTRFYSFAEPSFLNYFISITKLIYHPKWVYDLDSIISNYFTLEWEIRNDFVELCTLSFLVRLTIHILQILIFSTEYAYSKKNAYIVWGNWEHR